MRFPGEAPAPSSGGASKGRGGKLVRGIKRALSAVIDHYLAACLFLALFSMTIIGVGSIAFVGQLGFVLCIAGFLQKSAKVDLRVLCPLLVYHVISFISCYVAFQHPVAGYPATQSIFSVIYLLMACLDERDLLLLRRLCAAWAGAIAAIGICQFTFYAVVQSAKRLSGVLGNPNALGIFVVIAWFALLSCGPREGEKKGPWLSLLLRMEPLLLIAAALALSLGSFLSMAAGILVLFIRKARSLPFPEAFSYLCRILARASLGVGTGILLYLTATRTNAPWLCAPMLLYVLALTAYWEAFLRFLSARAWVPVAMAFTGLLVAMTAVAVRPSSIATFNERLAMMRNGLGYMTVNPLLGVGPYKWRELNLADADKFFNTSHIHNMFIHTGVELGLVAMAMLLVITVRCFRKKDDPCQLAQCAAFLFHNLIDTSFFYTGITSMMLLTVAEPAKGGKEMPQVVLRLVLCAFALMFAYNLYLLSS